MSVGPKPWSKAELEALLVTHKTWTKVARHLGVPRTTLSERITVLGLTGIRTPDALSRLPADHEWIRDRGRLLEELRKHGSQSKTQRYHGLGTHTVIDWVHRHAIKLWEWVPNPADHGVKRYDAVAVLDGDWCVSSDYQVPFTDERFCAQMAQAAIDAGVKNLLIAGDFVDLHNFSSFQPTSEQVSFSDTKAFLARFIPWLREAFPGRIVWTVGNHEDRLPRATKGTLGIGELSRAIGAFDEGFEIIDAPMVDIGDWRVIHPKSFSIVPGAVVRKLASKHLKNILCAHGHHTSISWDVSGRFRCIDIGGMFDPGRLEYIQRSPSTYPLLNQGFVLLKDGQATLVEP